MIRTKIEKKRQITNPPPGIALRAGESGGRIYFDRLSAACLRHHGAMPQEAHFGERAVQT